MKVYKINEASVAVLDQDERFECSERSDTSSLVSEESGKGNYHATKVVEENSNNPQNPQKARAAHTVTDQGDAHRRRAEICLTGGYDPCTLVRHLWRLVATGNEPPTLFLTDGGPVRLEIIDGKPVVTELTADRLRLRIHQLAEFCNSKGMAACPKQLVTEMLATSFSEIPLPRLRQVATAPLIASDTGTILARNGYYSDLGIFLWCEEEVEPISEAPTQEEVFRAIDILREPLEDFPFVNDASRATAMAIMITPFVRRLIKGPTPLHLIEKATPGTGASLLTDALLTPSVGTAVQKLTPPNSEHEWKYSLDAVLRTLPMAVVIDNVRELTSVSLAKALTDDVSIARIVGSSSVAALPILCAWVSTGNNPTLHQELARRSVRCRLDAGLERPWVGRTFNISNLKEWLGSNRPRMVWAVLTIIRSWFVAGQPRAERVLGMFESYSQVIGGILKHAGIEGFLGDGAFVESAEDLQSEAERWFATIWWSRYKGAFVHVNELVELVNQAGSPVLDLWGPETRPDSHPKRMGWFVRSLIGKTIHANGTVTGGPGQTVKICRCGDDPVSRTARYRLDAVKDPADPGVSVISEFGSGN